MCVHCTAVPACRSCPEIRAVRPCSLRLLRLEKSYWLRLEDRWTRASLRAIARLQRERPDMQASAAGPTAGQATQAGRRARLPACPAPRRCTMWQQRAGVRAVAARLLEATRTLLSLALLQIDYQHHQHGVRLAW